MRTLTTTLDTYAPQAPVLQGNPPVGARTHIGIACALQQGRTAYPWQPGGAFASILTPRYIYTPAHTLISLDVTFATVTYVECPSMSGTFYSVMDVQDIDKGTPSEQRRLAVLPLLFPVPLP